MGFKRRQKRAAFTSGGLPPIPTPVRQDEITEEAPETLDKLTVWLETTTDAPPRGWEEMVRTFNRHEIASLMSTVSADSTSNLSTFSTMSRWIEQGKAGELSVEDPHRRNLESTLRWIIQKIRDCPDYVATHHDNNRDRIRQLEKVAKLLAEASKPEMDDAAQAALRVAEAAIGCAKARIGVNFAMVQSVVPLSSALRPGQKHPDDALVELVNWVLFDHGYKPMDRAEFVRTSLPSYWGSVLDSRKNAADALTALAKRLGSRALTKRKPIAEHLDRLVTGQEVPDRLRAEWDLLRVAGPWRSARAEWESMNEWESESNSSDAPTREERFPDDTGE